MISKALTQRSWDFGDGTQLEYGFHVNHTYLESGTYTVVMTDLFSDGTTNVVSREQYIEVVTTPTDTFTSFEPENFIITEGGEGSITSFGGVNYPLAHQAVGSTDITDELGQNRTIVFDRIDRIPYEVFTDVGPSRPLVFKDKVDINLTQTSGYDYVSRVTSRGAVADLERYTLEPESLNLYIKSITTFKRCHVPILKSNQFNPNSRVSVKLLVDDEETTLKAENLKYPRLEIGYDGRKKGNVIQNKIEFDSQPLILSGFTENLIARDELAPVAERAQNESRQMLLLAQPFFLVTRSSDNTDLISGEVVSQISEPYAETAPDGTDGTAVVLTAPIEFDETSISDEIVMFWYLGVEVDVDQPCLVSVKEYPSGWMFVVLQKSAGAGELPTIPIGTIYDIRCYDSDIFGEELDSLTSYYVDDVINNTGLNILPAWIHYG